MRVVFVGRQRPVWKRLVLYLATLGISRRVWLHRIGREIDGHEALGIDHGARQAALAAAAAAPLILLLGTAGIPIEWLVPAAALTFLPGAVVAFRVAQETSSMLAGSGIPMGRGWLVWLPTLVPVLGHMFYIGWMQSRLNAFWQYEQGHPEHGVEVDPDLSADPVFRAEIGKALRSSYDAGSRFDRRAERRAEVRREREAIRAAGGSTPLIWWRAPSPPPRRVLHITCGRCDHAFDIVRDPLAETPIVCPNCGLADILPSLRGDTQATEVAGVPHVQVECTCGNVFHSARSLTGPTTLACPACGKTDVLEAPGAGKPPTPST